MCAYMLSRLSRVQLFLTPWTVALQAPLSMRFSRQEYWSGLPCPLPGDLPDPGFEPRSSALQVNSLLSESPGKYINLIYLGLNPPSFFCLFSILFFSLSCLFWIKIFYFSFCLLSVLVIHTLIVALEVNTCILHLLHCTLN